MRVTKASLPEKYVVNTLFIVVIGWFLTGCSTESTEPADNDNTPQFEISDFPASESCQGCHPQYYNEWKGSMHAYAFIDPVNTAWMNGLREVSGAETLGQFCVQCHSPIGMLTGETPPGFDKEDVASIVREGINCVSCHFMSKPSGTSFVDAKYHYDVNNGTQFGSIMDPVPNTAHPSEGKAFYSQSTACLPCHDLINQNGLPVEITYSEWLQSPYTAMGVECQDCHMERYSGKAAISGPQRDNLHRHDFIGVDVALLDNFPNKEEQRQKIEQLLRNAVSLSVEAPTTIRSNDTLHIKTTIFNDRTGHDIPSSVTFVRQMWLEVTISSAADTIYSSGYFDANGDLMDAHSVLNPGGDPDLVLFQSGLFRNGQPDNVFTADSIRIGSIAPFETKLNEYAIPLQLNPGGTLNVKVRLLFRTFPPYAIRDGAAEYIDNIPTFEMALFDGSALVTQ